MNRYDNEHKDVHQYVKYNLSLCMKRHYILSVMITLCLTSLYGKEVPSSVAEQIARQFFNGHVSTRGGQQQSDFKLVYVGGDMSVDNMTAAAPFYVFNYDDRGFVVVAGDDRMESILGYSDSGAFRTDNMPLNMRSWLDMYKREYESLDKYNSDVKVVSTTRADNTYKESIAPLLGDIIWDQDTPFSDLCPLDGTERSYTGCVATAMAMVMKYHGYPERGTGTISYTTETIKKTLSEDLSTFKFDWSNMLPDYTSPYTTAQGNAVAKLMYACGVAVKMDYTAIGSGADSYYVPQALIDNFGYDKNTQHILRDFYTYSEWVDIMKKELNEGRPIIYDGASLEVGHEFVIDGYDSNNMLHVNWGWSGYNDGYYVLTSLFPSGVGIGGGTGNGGGFDYDQGMIVGMQAPTTSSTQRTAIYLDGITFSSKKTKKGTSVSATLNDMYNYGASQSVGSVGLVVEKDGTQTLIQKKDINTTLDIYRGYKSINFSNVVFPTSLKDGEYVLYPVVRTDDASPWNRVRCAQGYDGIYRVTVSGDDVTIYSYWGDVAVNATLSIAHNLYAGAKGDFNLSMTNADATSEKFSMLALDLRKGNDDTVLDLGMLYLEAAEKDKNFGYTITLPDTLAAGEYTIYPVVAWGDEWKIVGEGVVTNVDSGKISNSDNDIYFPESPNFEKNSYEEGEEVRILGKIATISSDVVYDNTLAWGVFKRSGSQYSYLADYSMDVFIDKGGSYDIDFRFTPSLSKGTYYIALFGSSQLTNIITLNITEATGIDDVAATADRVIVYPQPVEETLNIRVPSEAQAVELYDISGRLVLTEKLSAGGTSYSINIGSIPAGTYILNVKTTGKVYKEKFVKK